MQGTANGYGERTGNADLFSVVANLELKLGGQVLPDGRLGEMTRVAHAVAEITNVPPDQHQPYVGALAVRAQGRSARQRDQGRPDLYQHIDPATVGNDMRMLVSEMAGRAASSSRAASSAST